MKSLNDITFSRRAFVGAAALGTAALAAGGLEAAACLQPQAVEGGGVPPNSGEHFSHGRHRRLAGTGGGRIVQVNHVSLSQR